MKEISGGSMSFFSEETYKAYLKNQNAVLNTRFRGEDETIFDVVLSEEADFKKHPEGKEILETIRNYK